MTKPDGTFSGPGGTDAHAAGFLWLAQALERSSRPSPWSIGQGVTKAGRQTVA